MKDPLEKKPVKSGGDKEKDKDKDKTVRSVRQQQILIVEDDLDLLEMLSSYFSVQGYKVLTVAWGEEAVDIALEKMPDLVVLDIRLPDIDGYEVARRLRDQHRTKNLPIIFLTERRERVDKLAGLELGVVDYITKPFDIQEVRLRVRNVLRRAASRKSFDNPVTGLPEGPIVDERLGKLLKDENPWGLLVVKLRGLSHFHKRYGFVASDDVLRAVSVIIHSALDQVDADSKEAFTGHLQQDTFVIVIGDDFLKPLHKRLDERLGSSMDYFYPLQDRLGEDKDDERLSAQLVSLRSADGPFESLEALKKAALQEQKAVVKK